jgi:hypothetical protein
VDLKFLGDAKKGQVHAPAVLRQRREKLSRHFTGVEWGLMAELGTVMCNGLILVLARIETPYPAFSDCVVQTFMECRLSHE